MWCRYAAEANGHNRTGPEEVKRDRERSRERRKKSQGRFPTLTEQIFEEVLKDAKDEEEERKNERTKRRFAPGQKKPRRAKKAANRQPTSVAYRGWRQSHVWSPSPFCSPPHTPGAACDWLLISRRARSLPRRSLVWMPYIVFHITTRMEYGVWRTEYLLSHMLVSELPRYTKNMDI